VFKALQKHGPCTVSVIHILCREFIPPEVGFRRFEGDGRKERGAGRDIFQLIELGEKKRVRSTLNSLRILGTIVNENCRWRVKN